MLGGLAGAGVDLEASGGEHCDGGRSDAAGGSGDDDWTGVGRDAALFDYVDRHGRRDPSGAEDHGLFGGHAVGQRGEPVAVDSGSFCVATGMGCAEVVAGGDDGVALRRSGGRRTR